MLQKHGPTSDRMFVVSTQVCARSSAPSNHFLQHSICWQVWLKHLLMITINKLQIKMLWRSRPLLLDCTHCSATIYPARIRQSHQRETLGTLLIEPSNSANPHEIVYLSNEISWDPASLAFAEARLGLRQNSVVSTRSLLRRKIEINLKLWFSKQSAW